MYYDFGQMRWQLVQMRWHLGNSEILYFEPKIQFKLAVLYVLRFWPDEMATWNFRVSAFLAYCKIYWYEIKTV